MKLSVIVGWVARVLVIVLALLNSRLLIELVGVDGLAVQSILISLSMWFALLNLGIPSAVQNQISRCRADGKGSERLKHTACNVVLMLFAIFLPIVICFGIAIKHLVLNKYAAVTTLTVIIFCVGLFIAGLSVVFNQILYAEQRGHWPNIYPAVNAVCVTICLIGFRLFLIRDINFVLLSFVFANLIVTITGFMQIKMFKLWYVDREILADIFQDCRGFALFAFLAASVLGIDYIVMSRLLPAQDIALYNICQRVFMALLSVHAIILTSAWPTVSETLFNKQWTLARARIRKLLILGGGMVIVLGGAVVVFMGRIADVISHHRIESVSVSLTLLFLIYMLLRVWSDTYAMALLSCNETKVLNSYVPFQAAISILAQITLGSRYGTYGIMLGLIISFIVTAVWILPRSFYRLTRENV